MSAFPITTWQVSSTMAKRKRYARAIQKTLADRSIRNVATMKSACKGNAHVQWAKRCVKDRASTCSRILLTAAHAITLVIPDKCVRQGNASVARCAAASSAIHKAIWTIAEHAITAAPMAMFAKMDYAPSAWAKPIAAIPSSCSGTISIIVRAALIVAMTAKYAVMDNVLLELAQLIATEKSSQLEQSSVVQVAQTSAPTV